MEIALDQRIYYSNEEIVPLKKVAESLIALEGIINQSPEVLEKLFPGTKIESVKVYLSELKSDSIFEDVLVKFVFGSQDEFDDFLASSRKKLGMDKLMENKKLFSVIIIGMILTGAIYSIDKNNFFTDKQKATIEANNNTIIQIGAGAVDLEADDLKAIIYNAIKDKKKLAKNAVKIIGPAKLDKNATITFNDDETLRINKETIRDTPHAVNEEDEEFVEDFTDVELEIRATDLDSTKRGWGVVVPDIYSKRVRMQLDPTIKPKSLLDKHKIIGDITVVFGYDKKNDRVPKLVYLRDFIEP